MTILVFFKDMIDIKDVSKHCDVLDIDQMEQTS